MKEMDLKEQNVAFHSLAIMCNKGEFRKSEFEKVLTKIKIKGFEPKLYDI